MLPQISWFGVVGQERKCPSYLDLPTSLDPGALLYPSWHRGRYLASPMSLLSEGTGVSTTQSPLVSWAQQLSQRTQSLKGLGWDLNPRPILCMLKVASLSSSSDPISLLSPLTPLPSPKPASLQGPPLPGNRTPGLAPVTENPGGLFKQVCLSRKIKQTGTLWGHLRTTPGTTA